MDKISAVKVFDCFGDLVDYVLFVFILKNVLADHTVQVDLHIFEHQIDIFVVICFDDVVQLDYVLVVKLLEEHYLSVGTLGVSRVLESIENLFQGQDLPRLFVLYLPDMSIGPTSDLFQQIVAFQYVMLYFLFHVIDNNILLVILITHQTDYLPICIQPSELQLSRGIMRVSVCKVKNLFV